MTSRANQNRMKMKETRPDLYAEYLKRHREASRARRERWKNEPMTPEREAFLQKERERNRIRSSRYRAKKLAEKLGGRITQHKLESIISQTAPRKCIKSMTPEERRQHLRRLKQESRKRQSAEKKSLIRAKDREYARKRREMKIQLGLIKPSYRKSNGLKSNSPNTSSASPSKSKSKSSPVTVKSPLAISSSSEAPEPVPAQSPVAIPSSSEPSDPVPAQSPLAIPSSSKPRAPGPAHSPLAVPSSSKPSAPVPTQSPLDIPSSSEPPAPVPAQSSLKMCSKKTTYNLRVKLKKTPRLPPPETNADEPKSDLQSLPESEPQPSKTTDKQNGFSRTNIDQNVPDLTIGNFIEVDQLSDEGGRQTDRYMVVQPDLPQLDGYIAVKCLNYNTDGKYYTFHNKKLHLLNTKEKDIVIKNLPPPRLHW